MEPTWRVVEFNEYGDSDVVCRSLSTFGATLLMEIINNEGGRAAIELEDESEKEIDRSGRLAVSAVE